jgi:hypothetical protein
MSSDIDHCIANLEIKLAVRHEEAKQILNEHVNKVFLISTENYCPVDKGPLKASAKKTAIVNGWRISYNTPYAIFVHERPGPRHFNPPSACWKYLERAVNETQNELYQNMKVVT